MSENVASDALRASILGQVVGAAPKQQQVVGKIETIKEDRRSPTYMTKLRITPEELHNWYLKGTALIGGEEFNEEAQVPYNELPGEQRALDAYIAKKINAKIFSSQEHVDAISKAGTGGSGESLLEACLTHREELNKTDAEVTDADRSKILGMIGKVNLDKIMGKK